MLTQAAPTPIEFKPITWQDAACPMCEATATTPLVFAPDAHRPAGDQRRFAVVTCGSCGLAYTNPRPDEASIGQFYSGGYVPHRRPRQGRRPLKRWYRRAGLIGHRCGERKSLPLSGRGRLLDFGCGGGSFLARMAEQGWRVTGIDNSAEVVRDVRESLGLDVRHGSLPHPDLGPCSFDTVTMWHSLEHVHDPLAVLRAARGLLVEGGRLLVSVPNIASWAFRWFGPSWFGLDLPRHLTHFTPRTLADMLRRAGYAVEAVRFVRHSDWMRSSAKLAVRDRRAGWAAALRFKPLARLATLLSHTAGRADCLLAVATK